MVMQYSRISLLETSLTLLVSIAFYIRLFLQTSKDRTNNISILRTFYSKKPSFYWVQFQNINKTRDFFFGVGKNAFVDDKHIYC